jgi:hypothetical protein
MGSKLVGFHGSGKEKTMMIIFVFNTFTDQATHVGFKKFWNKLIAYFPFTTISVCDITNIARSCGKN